jgi:carbonic anhydrase
MKTKQAALIISILIIAVFISPIYSSDVKAKSVPPVKAWEKLVEGNKRYYKDKMAHPRGNKKRRGELTKTQKPFAIILSCSDSRVPPELLFDQGLGDLFVVRTAGNVVDDVAIGSLEYAVEHLGVKLIVVLGHERCGAVSASVKGGEVPGHICAITNKIKPSVKAAKKQKGDLVENTVKENVRSVVKELKTSKPILTEFIKKHGLKIIGARYDLDTGAVVKITNFK